MKFLDQFNDSERGVLIGISESREFARDELLLRRGDEGGHLFLVEEGTVDVVNTREDPEVIVKVVGVGALLGELAFVDGAVRSVDLRCTSNSRVRVWPRDRLHATLRENLKLERSFYRALARLTTRRLRSMYTVGTSETRIRQGEWVEVERQAREVAGVVLGIWSEADARLRENPEDEEARSTLSLAFEALQERSRHWLGSIQDSKERSQAGEVLRQNLTPFLLQSDLCRSALEADTGDSSRRVLGAHILLDLPSGQGKLGEILDEFMLALPTSQAFRSMLSTLSVEVEAAVPKDRMAEVAILGVGCGALTADLSLRLARRGARIQLVEGTARVLDSLDMGMSTRPSQMEFQLVKRNIGRLALGRDELPFGAQDVIVVDCLAGHLPDRLFAALLSNLKAQLRSDSKLLLTGLAPSRDSVVFDHLLRWPLIRRSPRQILGLFDAAGYRAEIVGPPKKYADCALVIRAKPV